MFRMLCEGCGHIIVEISPRDLTTDKRYNLKICCMQCRKENEIVVYLNSNNWYIRYI
jgi:hypothetical protein